MIKYDLHLLGWHAFQQLCLTICREIMGQTVSSYLDSNDAGKDGAFTGVWKQQEQEDLQGNFVIQCKFTSKGDKNLSIKDLSDEINKAKRLALKGRCDCYLLITNYGVSGAFEEKFRTTFENIGIPVAKVYGSTWICSQIQENKNLRLLVPRIYGLGDLSQILDHRAYEQAKQLLVSMREDLSKIVLTSSYHKAAKAIDEHGFVLIIGEPAAGKTTIASMLAMAAVDKWGLMTVKIDRPAQVSKYWNPEDPNQFFWIDDAFGVTQYESDLVQGWNHIFSTVKTMLKQGVKVVMTSRDYIYKRARKDLKEGAFPLFNESQVVIDVHQLNKHEREQILYNHLKLGKQEKKFLTEIKPHLNMISQHDRFIPEMARRLSDPAFTKNLYLYPYSLKEFVEKQESFMIDTIRGLDVHSRAALGLIYMTNGFLESPVKLNDGQLIAVKRLGSDLGNSIRAMEDMRDSLVQFIHSEDLGGWRFKHPTIGDSYATIVSESPEQLEIYLLGTPVEKVMDQITCGNVGLEKAIIITRDLFPTILSKMKEFKNSKAYKTEYLSVWAAERKIYNFLSRRCSPAFIKLYIEQNNEILNTIIKPSLYFDYSEAINLVVKLNREALLPENLRIEFVDYISKYTIKGDDLTLLKDEDLQSVFELTELETVKSDIRKKLVPNLTMLLDNEINAFERSNDRTAEEHMENLLDRFDILSSEFEGEETVVDVVDRLVSKTKAWISDNEDLEREERPERKLDTLEQNSEFNLKRSIFDDIDVTNT
ncbi:MAG: hypothetical protein KUL85_16555 [Sphingobacterium mizutaii]|nr:hypothetical protein [Sphingobacterium mizutaii]